MLSAVKKTFIVVDCRFIILSMRDYLTSFTWNHVSTQAISVTGPLGSVAFLLQPTVTVCLAHCERGATFLFFTVVVTILNTLASEVPDVSTPVVYVIFNTG